MLADHHSANRYGAADTAFKRPRAPLDQGSVCERQSERAQVEFRQRACICEERTISTRKSPTNGLGGTAR